MATATAKARTAATPWGAASVIEEVTVPQRAGEKRFSVVVQLLETRSAPTGRGDRPGGAWPRALFG